MEVLITGGAGCIGSDLAARLLREGHQVTVFDNLSSGKEEHIQNLLNNDRLKFNKGDLLDKKQIENACKNIDVVFHLAANSDIKYRPEDPTDEDLKLNTIATYNVLEAMRLNSVKKIVFTSSSAVYGEAEIIPTPEDCGLQPISLYAASKAACEAMISGFCHMFEMEAWIFRLANIISGKSRKKGKTVLSDFIEKLSTNRKELEILGDGKQRKSYLIVNDCIDGIMLAMKEPYKQVNVLNLGPEDSITVDEIAEIVASQMGLKDVKFKHTGGDRGWPGDVPRFLLDTTKIRKLGWKPRHTSREAIEIATKSLLDQVIQ